MQDTADDGPSEIEDEADEAGGATLQPAGEALPGTAASVDLEEADMAGHAGDE